MKKRQFHDLREGEQHVYSYTRGKLALDTRVRVLFDGGF